MDDNNINKSKKFFYKAFGLNISSDYELGSLLPGDEPPEVEIIHGKVPEEIEGLGETNGNRYSSKNEFIFFVKDTVKCYIANGNRIVVEPFDESQESMIKLVILGGAISILLLQRGILPIHGSAIAIDGKCVIISGGSGAGKSTLTMGLRKKGHSFLTDDVVALKHEKDGRVLVYPGFPQQKLWRDSAEKYGLNVNSLSQVTNEIDKFLLPIGEDFNQNPVPLAALYELDIENCEEVLIKSVEKFEKLSIFIKQTYCYQLLPFTEMKQEHFNLCSELARVIPAFKIKRPVKGFTTEKQIELILEKLSLLNSN